jgi:DNA-binding MarR family transcriptional regulator
MNDKQKHALAIAEEIFLTMPFLMKVVSAELRREKSPFSVAQLAALNVLTEKPCNLSELAEFTAVSLPSMSGTVSKLVKHGFVERTRSNSDRRMIVLEITPQGQRLITELGEQLVNRVADLLLTFSESELTEIRAAFAHLQRAFRN